MSTTPNGSASATQLAIIQEERLQRVEDRVGELHTTVQAHVQTEDIRWETITQKISEMGDRLVEKIDGVGKDVAVLKERSDKQQTSIDELAKQEDERKKRKAWLLKSMWIIPGAALVEAGHQLFVWLMRLH